MLNNFSEFNIYRKVESKFKVINILCLNKKFVIDIIKRKFKSLRKGL